MTARNQPPDGEQYLGPFRLLEVLGQGAQGTVYLAERSEPIWQRVALKVLDDPQPSKELRARFEFERQALALMHHSNIARVIDTGSTDDGRHWIAMELVKGPPITEYCRRHRLDLRARLNLFAQVCHGVQHAHHKAIVHRDLKPSNILIAEEDGRAVSKIVDFGIAKSLDRPLIENAAHTEIGMIVGTFEYMSPEQAEGAAVGIDARTDVYSLGAILYELLAGEPPFTRQELLRRGLLEMTRVLCEEEPPRPSTRIRTSIRAERAATPTRRMCKTLESELDWIVMKALSKAPAQRYQTPAELALELDRYLRGDPIEARPPSLLYRLGKLASHHRQHVMWMAAVAVVALAGVATSFVFWGRAEAALDRYGLLEVGARIDELEAERLAMTPRAQWSESSLVNWIERAAAIALAVPRLEAARRALDPDVAEDRVLDSHLGGLLLRTRRFLADDLDASLAEFATIRTLALTSSSRDVRGPELSDRALAWMRIRLQRLRDAATPHPNWHDARELGLDLAPTSELIPILGPTGPNPRTGNWEFVHPGSGRPGAPVPTYGADGDLQIHDEHTGLVLVRIVTIDGGARLLSKHELSRANWFWLSEGERPSASWFRGDERMPVENFTTERLVRLLDAAGLSLPDDAEWESAAAGGSAAGEWGAFASSELAASVNSADQSFARAFAEHSAGMTADECDGWDDGHVRLAAPDALRANPFGFHHMLGNVAEICRGSSGRFTLRGGSYRSPSTECSVRGWTHDIATGGGHIGARPCYRSRSHSSAR